MQKQSNLSRFLVHLCKHTRAEFGYVIILLSTPLIRNYSTLSIYIYIYSLYLSAAFWGRYRMWKASTGFIMLACPTMGCIRFNQTRKKSNGIKELIGPEVDVLRNVHMHNVENNDDDPHADNRLDSCQNGIWRVHSQTNSPLQCSDMYVLMSFMMFYDVLCVSVLYLNVF